MRGRKPTPQAVKDLAGNPGKRKRRADPAPVLEPGAADDAPPDWLDEIAADEWRRVLPQLQRINLMRETDRTAFATYCAAFARYRRASALLDVNGMTYVTETKHGRMERIRPEMKIMQDAERTMRTFMAEFGITPSSRTRISAQLASSAQLALPLAAPAAAPPPEDQNVAPADGPPSALGFLN